MNGHKLSLLALCASAIALVAYGSWLWAQVGEWPDTPAAVAGVVIGMTLAALVLWRQRGNRVGRVLLLLGLSGLVAFVSEGFWELYGTGQAPSPAAIWAAKTEGATSTMVFGLMLGILPIVFPDGRPRTPWSRRLLGLAWTVIVVQSLSFLLSGQPLCVEEDSACGRVIDAPPGVGWIPNLGEPPLSDWMGPVILAVIVGGLVSAVTRYRSSHGVARLQLKWFAFGASLSLALIPPLILISELSGSSTPNWIFNLPFVILPLSIGLALLRYRLYEIDRIISRTVSYGLVVGLLGLAFVGLAGVVGWVLPTDNSLGVAAATLGVAALFNPLRRRVKALVDRRFNRARYDAERVMSDFAGSLRDTVDPGDVTRGWVEVVGETMQPTTIGVWVKSS